MHPVALSCPRVAAGHLIFMLGEREVVIEGDTELLLGVLGRCDGHTSLEEVVVGVPPDRRESVRIVLAELDRLGIVTDRGRTFRRLHADANLSPGLFACAGASREPWMPAESRAGSPVTAPATGLTELLRRRRSDLGAAGRPLDLPAASAVIAAAYGRQGAGRRTVPSAGALYPLVLHLAARRDLPGLAAGLHYFDPHSEALCPVAPGEDVDVRELFVVRAPIEPELDRSPALVVVSADVARSAATYSARGYRYALIEAGAALQNGLLAAAEAGVAARPLGLFDDARLAAYLRLGEDVYPVVGIALG